MRIDRRYLAFDLGGYGISKRMNAECKMDFENTEQIQIQLRSRLAISWPIFWPLDELRIQVDLELDG